MNNQPATATRATLVALALAAAVVCAVGVPAAEAGPPGDSLSALYAHSPGSVVTVLSGSALQRRTSRARQPYPPRHW